VSAINANAAKDAWRKCGGRILITFEGLRAAVLAQYKPSKPEVFNRTLMELAWKEPGLCWPFEEDEEQ
jgi:hypothetical protein